MLKMVIRIEDGCRIVMETKRMGYTQFVFFRVPVYQVADKVRDLAEVIGAERIDEFTWETKDEQIICEG